VASRRNIVKSHISISPRGKAILEVLAGLFLIFGYIWLVCPLYKKYWLHAIFIAMILALLAWSRHSRGESFRQLGFRWDNWVSSGRIVFAGTLAALLTLTLVWSLFRPPDLRFYRDHAFWLRLVQYPLWALLQQYIALAFFFRRFREVFSPHHFLAILASAATFSAMHIPNPPLIILTFLGGLFWSWAYHKRPNLFTIVLSHAILAVTCGHISLAYTVVGPFADIRWSKEHPIDYAICTVAGTAFSHKQVLPVSKADSSTIAVDGWARAAKGQVDQVFVRFGRRDYPASYGTEGKQSRADAYKSPYGDAGFRAEIPIRKLRPGYYRLSLKVSLKDRFFCHYPSRRMWIKIQP